MQKQDSDVFLHRKRLSSLSLVVISCGVITLSLLASWVSLQLEQANRKKEFERKASKAELSIQRALDRNIQSLESIVALYNASGQVERQEFQQFVRVSLLNNLAIQALEWVPRIPSTQRENYEQAARQDGFPDFQITERNQQRQIVRASQRPVYFPVYYVEPFQGNETALGFDLASNSASLKALNQARDQDQAIATTPIDLVQETEKNKKGILVVSPIFRQNQPSNSISARRQNLEGFTLSVFQIENLMNGILDTTHPKGFDFYLFDQSLPQGEQLLYTASSIPEKSFDNLNGVEINALQQEIYYSTTLDIAERQWLLIAKPNADSIVLQSSGYPWVILASGGVLVIGFIAYSKSQHRVRTQLQLAKNSLAQRVQERTTELQLSNQQLMQQMTESKQTEVRIHEITQRLALATNSAKIGVWDFDVVEDRLIWDDRMYELYGIKAEDFGGAYEAWKKGVHPEDLSAADADIQAAIAGEQEFHPEFRVMWPDGQVRFIEAHAIVLRDAIGNAQRMIGVNWDITDRKQIEQALARKVKQQATIAELGQLALASQNLNQLMDEMVAAISSTLNVEYCKILKLLPDGESLLLKAGVGWQPGLVGQAVIGTDENSQAGYTLRSTYPVIVENLQTETRFNGPALLCDHNVVSGISVIIQGQQRPFGVLGAHSVQHRLFNENDIDFLQSMANLLAQAIDRKQAEAQIHQQADLLNLAHDAILVRDLNGSISFWNQGAEVLYGWTLDEALGQNADQLLYKDSLSQEDDIQESFMRQGSWFGERQQVTKMDKDITVMSRWTLVRNEEGQPKFILTVNTDITEKKQFERQFLRAQRLESIGTLASGIAHDLNNILTPIYGVAQLLPMQLPNASEQIQHQFEIIQNSAKRGTEIIQQVLSFSRGIEGERTPLNVKYLISELRSFLHKTFPKSLETSVNLPDDLWSIKGDATQLYQVFMNLFINARDAMPEGGILTTSATNLYIDQALAANQIEAHVGPYIQVTVADTGVGIPVEQQERIFEPFFTTKQPQGGTGLGLSTVYSIVKSHGGFITVDSMVNQGTRFQVYLPAIETAEGVEEEIPDLPSGQGELILIVDDEAPIREVAQSILEQYNYQVLVATDGIDAISLYAKHGADIKVVIVDMQMPGLDGAMTIRTMQRINPQLTAIVVSGSQVNEQMAASIISENIKGFLQKPYSSEELLKTIHGLL